MITARPGVSRLSRGDSARPGGPGARAMILIPERWTGQVIHRGRAQVEHGIMCFRPTRTRSSRSAGRRVGPGPSQTRMIGCNGGCAGCEPGTRWTQGRTRGAAGGGGSGSVPAPTASSVPASWPPKECDGFFGCNGRLKLVGASVDGFLSRSLVRRIRSFASPVTGGQRLVKHAYHRQIFHWRNENLQSLA